VDPDGDDLEATGATLFWTVTVQRAALEYPPAVSKTSASTVNVPAELNVYDQLSVALEPDIVKWLT
jgi:uncharacterized membrane protein